MDANNNIIVSDASQQQINVSRRRRLSPCCVSMRVFLKCCTVFVCRTCGQVYSPSGELQRSFGTYGAHAWQFRCPIGLAFAMYPVAATASRSHSASASTGSPTSVPAVLVADQENRSVTVFSVDGNFLYLLSGSAGDDAKVSASSGSGSGSGPRKSKKSSSRVLSGPRDVAVGWLCTCCGRRLRATRSGIVPLMQPQRAASDQGALGSLEQPAAAVPNPAAAGSTTASAASRRPRRVRVAHARNHDDVSSSDTEPDVRA